MTLKEAITTQLRDSNTMATEETNQQTETQNSVSIKQERVEKDKAERVLQ